MKDIFLFFDFDGVLVTFREMLTRNKDGSFISALKNNIHLKTLNVILGCENIKAYFIPISSWAYVFKKKEVLIDFLKEEGFENLMLFDKEHWLDTNAPIDGIKDCCLQRAIHIMDFVKRNSIKNYLVFDDEGSLDYMYFGIPHICTSTVDGITGDNINQFQKYIDKFWKKESDYENIYNHK